MTKHLLNCDCFAACGCKEGYVLNGTSSSAGVCIPLTMCACYDEMDNTVRQPYERWTTDCYTSQCLKNEIVRTKNCAVQTCDVSLGSNL